MAERGLRRDQRRLWLLATAMQEASDEVGLVVGHLAPDAPQEAIPDGLIHTGTGQLMDPAKIDDMVEAMARRGYEPFEEWPGWREQQ